MKGFATALCVGLASLSLPLSAASAAVAATPAATASYVELGDYLRGEAEIEAWYEALYRLRDNFDQICGDTFCEGDYSNIQALRLRCSVDSASGLVGRCLWSFAASNEEIDPATGAIRVDAKVWKCRLPLVRGTSAQALLAAWAGERPLYAALPGTAKSAYEGLSDCL